MIKNLKANFAGDVRRETFQGRDFLVAPLTMIVPGVLNGSKGPLYYPLEELQRNPETWNHMPIVVYHPQSDDGAPITARQPSVLNKSAIGVVLNSRVDGKLIAEGWFDVEQTKRVDHRVYKDLSTNKKIELSTGLFTTDEPVTGNANYNGVAYEYIARNYIPDHLAVLPDQKGACSIKDGCGVNNSKNEETEDVSNMNKLTKEQRKEYVDFIVNNCGDCEWDDADDETLNNLPDSMLKSLRKQIEKANQQEAVANAALKGFTDPGGSTHVYNVEKGEWESKVKEPAPTTNETSEDDDETDDNKTANNKDKGDNSNGKEPKHMTEQEWLESAPEGVRSAVQNAMNIELEEKRRIVKKLIQHLPDDKKQAAGDKLVKNSLDDLKERLEMLPPEIRDPKTQPVYSWAGGPNPDGPTDNEESDYGEPLMAPSTNALLGDD